MIIYYFLQRHFHLLINQYALIEDNGEELEKRTHCYSPIPNFWNCYLKYYGYNFDITTMKIFDPIKGYYQNQMNLITEDPHESPIYFSSEVEDY